MEEPVVKGEHRRITVVCSWPHFEHLTGPLQSIISVIKKKNLLNKKKGSRRNELGHHDRAEITFEREAATPGPQPAFKVSAGVIKTDGEVHIWIAGALGTCRHSGRVEEGLTSRR